MADASKVQLRLGDRVVAEVAFEGEELRIGRMKENDLVINNLAVSRFHAVLRRVGNAFEIEDLGSENGTLVDGQAVCGTAGVAPGAAITIGKHTLFLRAGGEGTTQPPLPRKSDVWDAAQTYFVAGPVTDDGDAEAEAVVEAVGEDDDVANAVAREDDVVAETVEALADDLAAALQGEEDDLADAIEAVCDEEPMHAVDAVAADEEAMHALEAAPEEEALAEAVEAVTDEEPALEATDEAAPLDPTDEPMSAETDFRADPIEVPQALELPDPDPSLGFGEEELVGRAMPDPVAAEAPNAIVEPAELPSPETVPAYEAGPPRSPDVHEAAGQTSLFDFGVTDDLGLSDRSLARATSGPQAPTLHAGLIVEREGRVDRVVPWPGERLRVGRAPDCDLVLAGSGVSRRHAELAQDGTSHVVRDLGSANGVFVNGTRVEEVSLEQGDVIRIDDYTLTFVLDREPVCGSVQGAPASVARASEPAVAQAPEPAVAQAPEPVAEAAMSECDLVLADDADLEVETGEKALEGESMEPAAASRAEVDERAALGTTEEPLVWCVEVAVATERLPEAVRRALAEVDMSELVLPAQLRLIRRD